MQNFDLTDVSTDVGTIGNFAQVTGDASKYTADLTIPQNNTSKKVTITVSAESAQVANSSPAVLGPLEDTSKTFEIAAPTTLATVTGADSVCVLEKEIVDNDFLNEVIPHLGDNAGGAFTGVLESAVYWRMMFIFVVQSPKTSRKLWMTMVILLRLQTRKTFLSTRPGRCCPGSEWILSNCTI